MRNNRILTNQTVQTTNRKVKMKVCRNGRREAGEIHDGGAHTSVISIDDNNKAPTAIVSLKSSGYRGRAIIFNQNKSRS